MHPKPDTQDPLREGRTVFQHRIEGGPADLREFADFGLGHANRKGFSRALGNGLGLKASLRAGVGAGAAMAFEGGPEFVHESSVKYLTAGRNGRKVLYMNRSPDSREALITELAAKLPSKAAARRFSRNVRVAAMDEGEIRRAFEFEARISHRGRSDNGEAKR